MQEIIVSVPPIIVKEDTVEYKADSFRLKPNAMVEDLLKKMPGIEVDKNGNITAQGKTVTKVRVNGKDFFSGDPKAATQQLSADMIDKVQVVDDYGDLANASGIKDGEPDKVINLQLKKDRNRGVFSRTTVGAGTNDRYAATTNVNFFNNNKQLSVFGGANNNNSSTFDFNSSGGGGFGGQGGACRRDEEADGCDGSRRWWSWSRCRSPVQLMFLGLQVGYASLRSRS